MTNKEAKKVLRDAVKNAGGNLDIIVFDEVNKFTCIINALEAMGLCWCEINGEIYANRHEVYDIVGYRE